MICTSALLRVLGIGRHQWSSILKRCAGPGTAKPHGNTNKGTRKRKPDDPAIIRLAEHFDELAKFGEVQATRFVREKTGEVTERDNNDSYRFLPPAKSKRHYYTRYCSDNGYHCTSNSKGKISLTKKQEEGVTYQECVHWSVYWWYWRDNYSFLKVNLP